MQFAAAAIRDLGAQCLAGTPIWCLWWPSGVRWPVRRAGRPVDHFDVYAGAMFDEISAAEADFLHRHLVRNS